MSKLLYPILLALIAAGLEASALDFSKADALFSQQSDYQGCKSVLTGMKASCTSGTDKSELCWRLARVQVLLGMEQSSKEEQRKIYSEGVTYASEAIEADPSNHKGYMWHCACAGRECQTKSMMDQAKCVPVMLGDLEIILNKLGHIEYSEAWQALAEIFYHHPFKSNDISLNYFRQAALTIPESELRISTLLEFAQVLDSRGWSADKRRAEAGRNARKYSSAASNTDKYAYLDGKLGADFICAWSNVPYGNLSDKEEASEILKYCIAAFDGKSNHTKTEKSDIEALKKYQGNRK